MNAAAPTSLFAPSQKPNCSLARHAAKTHAGSLARQARFLSRSIPYAFDDRSAEVYGQIRGQLSAKGKPIGPNDFLIAAIAIANDLTLVTRNVGEFGRVPNPVHGEPRTIARND